MNVREPPSRMRRPKPGSSSSKKIRSLLPASCADEIVVAVSFMLVPPPPSPPSGKAMGRYAVTESLQDGQLVYQQIQQIRSVWPGVARYFLLNKLIGEEFLDRRLLLDDALGEIEILQYRHSLGVYCAEHFLSRIDQLVVIGERFLHLIFLASPFRHELDEVRRCLVGIVHDVFHAMQRGFDEIAHQVRLVLDDLIG